MFAAMMHKLLNNVQVPKSASACMQGFLCCHICEQNIMIQQDAHNGKQPCTADTRCLATAQRAAVATAAYVYKSLGYLSENAL